MAVASDIDAPYVVKLTDTRSYSGITRIISYLQSIPGRKALILLSNNMPPYANYSPSFSESALRSSTTIYQCALPGWRDHWAELAKCTGGYVVKARDDGFSEVEQVLRDFDRCYLLGYKPDRKTLESLPELNIQPGVPQRIVVKDHSLQIRIRKPGFKVNSRPGFTDFLLRNPTISAGMTQARSPRDILSTSPFVAGNLQVTAEALPFYNSKKESVIRIVLHIDGTPLNFRPDAEDGYRIAEVSIFGSAALEGRTINTYRGAGSFRAPVKGFTNRLKQGFVSTMDIPVPGPGSYELRSTISQSGLMGNVSMLVGVPNFAGSDLVASGISTFNTGSVPNAQVDPGIVTRRIRRSDTFACSLSVYNARLEDGKAKIEAQLRLYRDDVLVKASEITPVSGENPGSTSNEIPVKFEINPSPELTAGNYLVEVMVIDRLAGKKHGTAAQSAAIELLD